MPGRVKLRHNSYSSQSCELNHSRYILGSVHVGNVVSTLQSTTIIVVDYIESIFLMIFPKVKLIKHFKRRTSSEAKTMSLLCCQTSVVTPISESIFRCSCFLRLLHKYAIAIAGFLCLRRQFHATVSAHSCDPGFVQRRKWIFLILQCLRQSRIEFYFVASSQRTGRAGLKGRGPGQFLLEGPYDEIHDVIVCKIYIFADPQRYRLLFLVADNVFIVFTRLLIALDCKPHEMVLKN